MPQDSRSKKKYKPRIENLEKRELLAGPDPILADHLGTARDETMFLDNTNDTKFVAEVDQKLQYGAADALPVIGDWDGDGFENLGRVFDGVFLPDLNGDDRFDSNDARIPFGAKTDLPAIGDWDGDGKDNIGVFRPQIGAFLLDYNGNYRWDGPSVDVVALFGATNDKPVIGDWNHDGFDDIGVFRRGRFYLDANGNRKWDGYAVDTLAVFGAASDLPIAGDWDGDGTTNIGVYRSNRATFFLDTSGNGRWNGPTVDTAIAYGAFGDVPIVGNWKDTTIQQAAYSLNIEGKTFREGADDLPIRLTGGTGFSQVVVQVWHDGNLRHDFGFKETNEAGDFHQNLRLPFHLIKNAADIDAFVVRITHAGLTTEFKIEILRGLTIDVPTNKVREGHEFIVAIEHGTGESQIIIKFIGDNDTEIKKWTTETDGSGYFRRGFVTPPSLSSHHQVDGRTVEVSHGGITERYRVEVHKAHVSPNASAEKTATNAPQPTTSGATILSFTPKQKVHYAHQINIPDWTYNAAEGTHQRLTQRIIDRVAEHHDPPPVTWKVVRNAATDQFERVAGFAAGLWNDLKDGATNAIEEFKSKFNSFPTPPPHVDGLDRYYNDSDYIVQREDFEWGQNCYHPGAHSLYRIYKKGDISGTQVAYDALGNIITTGPAAGTPDIISPAPGRFAVAGHIIVDVLLAGPFCREPGA